MKANSAGLKSYSETVEAMKAIGLSDATGPLYDLTILGGAVPKTVKLDFTATNPSCVLQMFVAQIYSSGLRSGAEIAQLNMREALGISR